jgi:hypothetical protein
LVHLTREYPPGVSARQNLKSILDSATIEARNPYGLAVRRISNKTATSPADLECQQVVCFTETPLEHVTLIAQEIKGRQYNFEPYGVVITKQIARRIGVNPVWYLDTTPGHEWLVNPLEQIIDSAVAGGSFKDSAIARLAPFTDSMGTQANSRKEFWWEREWRHVGNFDLIKTATNYLVICPEADFQYVCPGFDSRKLIDAAWSQEQIIGHLAGFDPKDLDPFALG